MILGLAPMDGITNIVYRTIVGDIFNKYNTQPDNTLWTWTEFMNADGYMIQPARLVKHLFYHDQEPTLTAQIYGGNKQTLLQTALDIQEKYPDYMAIELNIGCPSPKVMACGGGSGMMREPSYAIDVIKTISEAIDMPFSIKVRAGLTLDQKQEWFDALVQAIPYCHCISIHARTFKQGHTGENDRGYIARFQQIAGDKCKVIGNGGIRTYQDAIDIQHRLQKDHGLTLDGIMIGQAAIGNPWVFVDHTPTPAQQHQLILDHMHLTLAWHVLYEQMVTTHPELHKDAPTGDLIDTNKQYLRAFKNYDPNSDEQYEFPDLQRHDYTFPQTKYTQLMEIKTQIANDPPSHIDPQTDYHCLVEFRKYLFNYIKGIDGSKDAKQIIAKARDYQTLKDTIDNLFPTLQ